MMRRHMRNLLFGVVALSTITITSATPGSADWWTDPALWDQPQPSDTTDMASDVTGSFSGLGKAITIPAYARGIAEEAAAVEKFKRREGAKPQARPGRELPGHRAH
jgi:hypothetical protein